MSTLQGPEPRLIGLVLAGGQSTRMGADKGSLELAGQPLATRCVWLLAPLCSRVLVSVRADQAAQVPYRELPLVTDTPEIEGPAAGLMSAWAEEPDAALLVLAVDLPLVGPETLGFLVRHRDPSRLATAFRHPDGALEPLCAVWEPRAAGRLTRASETHSAPSLRRVLESGPVAALEPPEPAQLASCNTPEAFAAALVALEEA